VETTAQQRPEYEFTTLRIVLLVIAITLWVLLAVAATARDADPETTIGYFLGSLFFPLLVAWVVRSLFRLARRRPVVHPAWTPGLFVGAVVLMVLQAAGSATPPS
jgi:drug/metabolite transporter (DMT)-like permease